MRFGVDRIEEYRRDWVGGSYRRLKKTSLTLPRLPRRLRLALGSGLLGVGLGLILLCFTDLRTLEPRLRRILHNQMCHFQTALELSTQQRLLRQHYLAHGCLPSSPELYLKGYLRSNKPFPLGCDFWGHPYRVDRDAFAFGVRSSGPNGSLDDADDLVISTQLKDLEARR